MPIDPDRVARGLSIAEQQIVEIAKALSFDAKVVVMDEPTAALSATEVARLFGVVESLREHGAAVVFISHRLEEVFAICQRVTVLRDGRRVLSQPVGELTAGDLVRAMVGRDIAARAHEHHEPGRRGPARRGALARGHLRGHLLRGPRRRDRRAVGPGRRRAQRGCPRRVRHRPLRRGRRLRRRPPAAIRACRSTRCAPASAFVPEDRRQQGLVMDMSIADNVSLASLRALTRHGLLVELGRAALRHRMGGATAAQVQPHHATRRPRSRAATSRRWCSRSG